MDDRAAVTETVTSSASVRTVTARCAAASEQGHLSANVVGVMQQAVIDGEVDSDPARGQAKAVSRGLTVDERHALLEWLDSFSLR